ncbi:MAG: biotin--[acetyl-CoA-carboxylase] ligase [Saprospiraceae bacterium]|nr:biotin--[acetyl-CoA-carboxylase] ligase [Saprospiraceae bacterium]MBK9630392.1 biotin--[acetyl-CoA-carboxylase] ligase [Saprospiraceae bacterium]
MKYPNPGLNYIHLLTSESTNDFALDYLSKTIPKDGFFVLADFQTGGKGQYGRKWDSEASKNLLVSYIFGSSFLKLDQIFGLHLAGSLAIADLLDDFRIEDIRIKWPNDVLVGGRKIAGILIQNVLKGQQLQHSVFGIGLNINQTNFETEHRATSLINLTGQENPILEMAFKLRIFLQKYLDLIRNGEHRELLFKYNEQLFMRNEIGRFKIESNDTFEAMIRSVDENGMLVLEKDGLLSKHHFGELHWEWK